MKQITSFSLTPQTIAKIDVCSQGHRNRSEFIDWLAENDFFLNKETLEKLRVIAEAKSDLTTSTTNGDNK